MGKTFSIADAFQNVPNPGTDREQITYISADLLVNDENNFYHMDNLDELAGNIQLVGLQQPIRVRPDGAGKYIIISGHRRRAAIEKLREEESERWAEIPCIIEDNTQESDAMRELRLIFANMDTRKMSGADIDRQAQRVQELLYQLKEEGVEFPGRMRDYVAEACKVSKSKLSRLKVIREGLISPLLSIWERGGLTESCAVRIAQEDPDTQASLFAKTDGIIQQLDFAQIDSIIYDLTHREIDFAAVDKAIEKKKAEDLHGEFDASEYLAQRAAEDIAFLQNLSLCAGDFIGGLYHSGRNKNERVDWLKKTFRWRGSGCADYDWEGESKGLRIRSSIGGYVSRTWSDVYDMLCSIALRDYGKMEQQPIGQTMIAGWMPGGTNPGHSCQCVVEFDLDGDGGGSHRMFADWNATLGRWKFSRSGPSIDMEPIRWMELPEVDA